MAAPEESAPMLPAGVLRRLGAIVYDSLLLLAVLLVASIPPVLLNGGPMRDGTSLGEFKNMLYLLYLLLLIFLFYGWFWTRNGQTLGMAAWRIQATSEDGSPLSWEQALIRLSTALLGLANLWIWFDPRQQGWHERLSRTRTVRLP
ncbi:MAG TPA: RDD family protein [Gammaproteobacteria bacterium]|nr:RDD family protein [Gammaproteobacteria bacterium]